MFSVIQKLFLSGLKSSFQTERCTLSAISRHACTVYVKWRVCLQGLKGEIHLGGGRMISTM